MNCICLTPALLPVSEEIRQRLSPGPDARSETESPTDSSVPFKLDSSPSSRTNSMLLERPVSIVITPSLSPSPYLEDSPVSESEAFVWPTECQHTLLDPGVVNDLQTQALLLTTLVSTNLCRISSDIVDDYSCSHLMCYCSNCEVKTL